jgi:hypothetical protein
MVVEPSGTHASVAGAIRQAAQMTGADFRYLLATTRVESNLNPNAQVPTSSARGLFQFIDQTWLATLKEQGPTLGYAPYARAISQLPSGEYAVTDRRLQKAIMNLRSDPGANALMAGAFTRVNAAKLAARLGRDPTEGELYIAHFLGPNGAGRLIGLAASSPAAPAAAAFPEAAADNPSIFYDRRGRARGAGEVYRAGWPLRRGPGCPRQLAGTGECRPAIGPRCISVRSRSPECGLCGGGRPVGAAGAARRQRSRLPRPVSHRHAARGGGACGQRAVERAAAHTGCRPSTTGGRRVRGQWRGTGRRARPVSGAVARRSRAVPRPGLTRASHR